jgi:hypothetical protein
MFPKVYFVGTYFPETYWPPVEGEPPVVEGRLYIFSGTDGILRMSPNAGRKNIGTVGLVRRLAL